MKLPIKLFLLICLLLPGYGCGSNAGKDNADNSGTAVNMWAIDMTVLKVKDSYYAVWSGWDDYYVESECPVQNLYIAPMTFHDEKPYVRLGQRILLSEPGLPWELKVKEHISLQEGPQILYHEDDIFIVYSTRGSWTVNYKLGQLRLNSLDSDPLDPASWTKGEKPVFCGVTKEDGLGYLVYGVGHASFTQSPDDSEYWINYHSKTATDGGWGDRKVFFQKFTFDSDGNPDFGVPANPEVPMKKPAGEVEREKANGVENPSEYFSNPTRVGADPWITKVNGKYYTCKSGGGGVLITESDYMTRFDEGKGYVRVWTMPAKESNAWNITSLWAPELHYVDGKWYIFYAAGQQGSSPFWSQRTGVLVSKTGPFGPYEENDDKPLFTGENI